MRSIASDLEGLAYYHGVAEDSGPTCHATAPPAAPCPRAPAPLSCDCYDGCWGEHSEGWERIGSEETARQWWKLAQRSLPYGTYVLGRRLRVQTSDLKLKLLAAAGFDAGEA